MNQRGAIIPERPDRLIVPLDGSRVAERSVPVARDLALKFGIPVTVVHVFGSIRELRAAAREEIDWTENAEPRAQIAPTAAIEDSVNLLITSAVTTEVIGGVGTASDEILRELEHAPNAWIVLTSMGSSGVSRLFLGSTAREIIRSSQCPVVLVPSDGASLASITDWTDIAVFLDGSVGAEGSICSAAALAEAADLDLKLVRVAETFREEQEPRPPEEEKWELPARAEAESYLDRMLGACSSINTEVSTVTLSGSPERQLPAYVESESPDLVTLAVRKRSGIERWTYGSLAERLLDTLTVPLLLVPVREFAP